MFSFGTQLQRAILNHPLIIWGLTSHHKFITQLTNRVNFCRFNEGYYAKVTLTKFDKFCNPVMWYM